MSSQILDEPKAPTKRSESWEREYIDNYWLGLGDTSKLKTVNPFLQRTEADIENPHIFLLSLMRKPENFYFTCKWLLNIRLALFQVVILQELWYRPFPILIATRGGSKCVTGNTWVMTKEGARRIETLVNSSEEGVANYFSSEEVLGENGFQRTDYGWDNGVKETRKITTQAGFELEGTLNHPIRVLSGEEVVWKQLSEIVVGDKVLIDRTVSWPKQTSKTLPADLCYLLGLLVGDGGYTVRGRISLTSADEEIVSLATSIAQKYWGKTFVRNIHDPYGYNLYGVKHWDRLFDEYGFNSYECGKKDFPAAVLASDEAGIIAFISGLIDTDGCVTKRGDVTYSSKSEELVKTLQFVLTRFGIISRRIARLNKKYNKYYNYLSIRGKNARLFLGRISCRLTRKLERLKRNDKIVVNSNNDFIPREIAEKNLVELHYEWKNVCAEKLRNKSRLTNLFSLWRLKKYGTTYEYLDKFLSIAEDVASCEPWKQLKRLAEKNYYYDEVVSYVPGFERTYDIHVPEDHSYVSNGFVSHNTFLLGLYSLLRALFTQGSKVVIVGSTFRQAKAVFEYAVTIWNNAPVLRDLVGNLEVNGPRFGLDKWIFRIGESKITALPLGTGDTIRGERATHLIADEFQTTPIQIYENVVQGFGSVSANPVEQSVLYARMQAMKSLGLVVGDEADMFTSNQSIISGTAFYAFNHFHRYWRKWKAIVESRGDIGKLSEVFQGEVGPGLNWKDFSIIRLPVELLPPKFMDEKTIAKAKATVDSGIYGMEYGSVFQNDSNGFFRASLIESCVVGRPNNTNPPTWASCGIVQFYASLVGRQACQYVMAVDPASESDNFAIVIIELWPDHRRVVYCWTTTRKRYKEKLKKKLVEEKDFYHYAARKIRALLACFPCLRLGLDMGGGGVAVIEALQNTNVLKPGEQPILPIIDEDPKAKPKPTDEIAGIHIIEEIQFAKYTWVSEANHGLKKDLEDKVLLFPEFDPTAFEQDKLSGRVSDEQEALYDTLEDCVLDIEDLKTELATIVRTEAGVASGRERWDTPDIKQPGSAKGRMKKDRYSALLIANMIARQNQRLALAQAQAPSAALGGFANNVIRETQPGSTSTFWTGPQWFTQAENQVAGHYGVVVKR